MNMAEKRDYREETALNAAEFSLLKDLGGEFGLAKSAVLRLALHFLGDHVMRQRKLRETGVITED